MAQRIIVKYALSISALFLAACNLSLFDKSDNILASYRVGRRNIIEVHSVSYGATTKGITIIGLKDGLREKLDTLKRIDDNFETYKTDIIKINDSIFQVKFTGTTYYKGRAKYFSFNIKESTNKP